MTGRLILVRHGETEGNVAKQLDTKLPGAPLTELGVMQARTIAERFAAEEPVALVSSHALRALQTASYIEGSTSLIVQALDGLHEAQAGDLEGKTDEASHELFKKVFHDWHMGDLTVRVPGGESGQDVLDRYVPVLDQLREQYLDSGDVVVVSHGAAIRLVGRYLGNVPGLFSSHNHLDNTQTVELVPTPDGWECVRWAVFEPPFEQEDVAAIADDPMG
ncbi:histidine phosphatase family protein [Antrihabitans cavernicola]|uniref:Histidine phosphatase family protein n=1 Tax=Antrihabitans cavernicola TaxID=2495913 RepID=A0A5A7SHR1_9NOCA|nr:histidine phosphatase family protein [Spelaeibacter cavernicola]KAA0024702.1 histidine phosphatase family protein [Spelaeibacter cavernicola]